MGVGRLEGWEGRSNQKKANKVYQTVESCGELDWWCIGVSAFLGVCPWSYASAPGTMRCKYFLS